MSDVLKAAALAYAAKGIPVFPCKPADKSPLVGPDRDSGGRAVPGSGGFRRATCDPVQIDAWWTKHPEAMIGIPTGSASGIDVLDIDVKYDGFASVPGWEALSPVIVRTPSGGAHVWFKADGVHCTTSEIGPGVDTRGEGGYVIAPPSCNEAGSYTFQSGSDVDRGRLPTFAPALRGRIAPRQARTPTTDAADTDPALVAAALAQIPNDDLGWGEWKRIGLAVWAATDGGGFELFDDFSRKSRKYDASTTRREWRGMTRSPPDRIGAGSLFYLASRANPDWLAAYDRRLELQIQTANSNAAAWLERVGGLEAFVRQATIAQPRSRSELRAPKHQLDHSRGTVPSPEGAAGEERTHAVEPPRKQLFFRHGEVAWSAPRWTIRNRIPERGAGLLIGQWGTFKTFVELDLAAHVMLGWDWTGEPVYRRGGVLMFACEGGAGLPLRLEALVETIIEPRIDEVPEGLDPRRLPFVWSESCPPLLGKKDPLPELLEIARGAGELFERDYGLPLALITIDTMAVAAQFQNENDNGEVSRAMAALHDLSRATGAVVLGIDHLGKKVSAGARGASAKEANVDFVLEVQGERDDETAKVTDTRLTIRKMRDGPQGEEIAFDAQPVDMGEDEHGYPVTSVAIRWDVVREPRPQRKSTPSKAEQLLAEAFERASGVLIELPNGKQVTAVPRDELRHVFCAGYKPGDGTKESARQEAFRKALKAALGRGTLVKQLSAGVEFFRSSFAEDAPM